MSVIGVKFFWLACWTVTESASHGRVGRGANVAAGPRKVDNLESLIRFARGDQSLRLDIADRLAAYFGLELQPTKASMEGK